MGSTARSIIRTTGPRTQGRALRAARIRAGLRQRDLADAMGCTFQYVAKLEASRGVTASALAHYVAGLAAAVQERDA